MCIRDSINTQSFFEYKAIAFDEYYYTFAKVCFPIRITPSILGKSGFKHEFGDWYINKPAEGIAEGLPFLRYNHSDSCWYFENIALMGPIDFFVKPIEKKLPGQGTYLKAVS